MLIVYLFAIRVSLILVLSLFFKSLFRGLGLSQRFGIYGKVLFSMKIDLESEEKNKLANKLTKYVNIAFVLVIMIEYLVSSYLK